MQIYYPNGTLRISTLPTITFMYNTLIGKQVSVVMTTLPLSVKGVACDAKVVDVNPVLSVYACPHITDVCVQPQ